MTPEGKISLHLLALKFKSQGGATALARVPAAWQAEAGGELEPRGLSPVYTTLQAGHHTLCL